MSRRTAPWREMLLAGLAAVAAAHGSEEGELRFNRVEGIFLGARKDLAYPAATGRGSTSYGHLGYAFGARTWQYQVGIEEFFLRRSPRRRESLGVELHDRIESQDTWLLSTEENSVYAALFRRDYFDYYQRRGWSVYTRYDHVDQVRVTGRWSRDEFSSLDSQGDWSPVDWHLGRWHPLRTRLAHDAFRANPAADEGRAFSLRLDIRVDPDRPRWSGRRWRVEGMVEHGGGRLGGDFAFRRFLLDARRYLLHGGNELDLRLRLGRGSGELPRQYLYHLGGYATLRGYPHKAFSGDRMVLLNIEYWHEGVGVLLDTGAAWFSPQGARRALERGAPEPEEGPRYRRSLGFAARLEDDFRVGMARPLDGPRRDWRYFVRCSRTF